MYLKFWVFNNASLHTIKVWVAFQNVAWSAPPDSWSAPSDSGALRAAETSVQFYSLQTRA